MITNTDETMDLNAYLHIAFVDVGQGDSTIIVLPDKTTAVIVDCPKVIKSVTNFIEEKNVSSLSSVILTHTDLDHIEGVTELLENFNGEVVEILYNHDTPRVADGKRKVILRKLVSLIRRNGWSSKPPIVGLNWAEQSVDFAVLHPNYIDKNEAELIDAPNDSSVVLKISFLNKHVLLSGDVQGRGWKWIIDRNTNIEADVLKFPHHGSWYTPNGGQPSLSEVLALVKPKLVIVSVGSYNIYKHPHKSAIESILSIPEVRLICTEATQLCHALVKSTNQSLPCGGTIEVKIKPTGIEVLPEEKDHRKIIDNLSEPKCKRPQDEKEALEANVKQVRLD